MTVTHCPVCNTPAEADGQHMICAGTFTCSAQAEARLRHWFHTVGNANGFGPETVHKLVEAEIVELGAVYAMTEQDFQAIGFGPGQSRNLVSELRRSREEPVRDWRWLAAHGIRHLGRGDARRLLAHIPLRQLEAVTAEEIAAIEGFGPKTSAAIADALVTGWPWINELLELGFNLQSDAQAESAQAGGTLTAKLAGKRVVFTGTMSSMKRKDMESSATEQGALVQSAVNGQTDWLVIGEKAGSKLDKANKLNDAGKANIEILTESDYLTRIE